MRCLLRRLDEFRWVVESINFPLMRYFARRTGLHVVHVAIDAEFYSSLRGLLAARSSSSKLPEHIPAADRSDPLGRFRVVCKQQRHAAMAAVGNIGVASNRCGQNNFVFGEIRTISSRTALASYGDRLGSGSHLTQDCRRPAVPREAAHVSDRQVRRDPRHRSSPAQAKRLVL
jgi:hypothetical protein